MHERDDRLSCDASASPDSLLVGSLHVWLAFSLLCLSVSQYFLADALGSWEGTARGSAVCLWHIKMRDNARIREEKDAAPV